MTVEGGLLETRLPPDWRERLVQTRTITWSMIAAIAYLAAVLVGLVAYFGYRRWLVGSGLLVLGTYAAVFAYHCLRTLYWRRRAEGFPPLSGWGVVNDRQAVIVLAVLGVAGVVLVIYSAVTQPDSWLASFWVAVLAYLFVVTIVVPGVVVRRRADVLVARYLARHPEMEMHGDAR